MEEAKNQNKDFTNSIIDFLFSKDNRRYIVLIFLFGLIFRVLISLAIPFGADEMGYVVHSIGFIDSGKLQIHDQDGLWFFLSDLVMKIFGVTVFGARFLAALFGSLSIILIYLIGKEIFNRKTALIAAAIMAISSYSILNSIGVMDVPMAFFSFLSLYFLILFIKTNKSIFFISIWVSLGLAIMIKQIALLFIPAFLLFLLYSNKKNYNNFKLKQALYTILILLLMVVPVLTYNYLLYKDKQIVDLQFSRFFGLAEEQYASISHTLTPFSLKTLFVSYEGGLPGILVAFRIILSFESIAIFVLSMAGVFEIAKSKNRFKYLLFLSFLFPFLFLAATSLLPNHFVFVSLFFALFSARGIDYVSNKFTDLNTKKLVTLFLLILVFLSSFYQIYKFNEGSVTGNNEIGKLINFKEGSISEDSLVIVDSRIYRGRTAFMFWDRAYLESSNFIYLSQNLDQFPGEEVPMHVYFIEAATDDSGWGSIKDQPEFNQTTEQLVSFFEQNAQLIKTINGQNGEAHFKVYEGTFYLKPSISGFVKSSHSFFFYPLEYKPKSEVFDNYQTYNLVDSLIDKFAHGVLYLEVFLSLFVILFIFFELYKSS